MEGGGADAAVAERFLELERVMKRELGRELKRKVKREHERKLY